MHVPQTVGKLTAMPSSSIPGRVAGSIAHLSRPCAVAVLALLVVAVAPLTADARDGWFRVPAPSRDFPTDVAGLPDGSIVVAYQSGRTWRYSGAGWSRIAGLKATGVVSASAGGLLATSPSRNAIMAWQPDWTRPQRVAGGRSGFAGDGGPALLASLSLGDFASSVAVLSDGAILIPDTDNHRVRRVDPGGTITTVAGVGRAGSRGDGGPASAARLNEPVSVAATPDGGYVIADAWGGRLRRVNAAGTISTPARLSRENPTDVAVTRGDIFVSDAGRLRRLGRDGHLKRGRTPGFALRMRDCADAVGTDAAGGLLTVGTCGAIWYRPATQPARAFASLRATRVNRRGLRVTMEGTHPGLATVELRRGGRPTAHARRKVASGRATLGRRRPLANGWHRLRLTLATAAGTARDRAWVYVVDRLTRSTARRLMSTTVDGVVDGGEWWLGRRCRRFGSRRVDCEVRTIDVSEESGSCDYIASLRVGADGIAVLRRYRCGARDRLVFRRRPHWYKDGTENLRP